MKQTCSLQSYDLVIYARGPSHCFLLHDGFSGGGYWNDCSQSQSSQLRRCCGRRLLHSDTVVVSLTTFQAVNSVTEITAVGGSLSQTLVDFLDYILGVKSILFSHLSYFASRLEEQTETAGLARFGSSCRRDRRV